MVLMLIDVGLQWWYDGDIKVVMNVVINVVILKMMVMIVLDFIMLIMFLGMLVKIIIKVWRFWKNRYIFLELDVVQIFWVKIIVMVGK